jgi:hypothetical protein
MAAPLSPVEAPGAALAKPLTFASTALLSWVAISGVAKPAGLLPAP